jgi:hypothetical protein
VTLNEIRARATVIAGLPFDWAGDHQLGACLRSTADWIVQRATRAAEEAHDELQEMAVEADAIYHGPFETCDGCGRQDCACDDYDRESDDHEGEADRARSDDFAETGGKDWT